MSVEILAPAADRQVLNAAVGAKADAVYAGLQSLNARRGARNFTQEEFADAVKYAHEQGAKVYLTLNTDLEERELNQALRTLAFANDIGADAVLVKDAALLSVIRDFNIPFHFSTQAGVSSSAGMEAAAALGIKRVVLARELSVDEMRACTQKAKSLGIETEVFVQGALCFSVSGRCLLSSWAGGRSGNRGCCASPCRVSWNPKGERGDCTPFSMHDLSLAEYVPELEEMGIDSLKIEGRLKRASWVERAVGLFVRARSGECGLDERLGDYTGRRQTQGYYLQKRDDLTGTSGRTASAGGDSALEADAEPDVRQVRLRLSPSERGGIDFEVSSGSVGESLRIPPRALGNVKKAVSVKHWAETLSKSVPQTLGAGELLFELDPETALPASALKGAEELFGRLLRKLQKAPTDVLRYTLADNLKERFALKGGCQANTLKLGVSPNRIRLDVADIERFAIVFPGRFWIIPCRTLTEAEKTHACVSAAKGKWMLALPEVVYEEDLPEIKALIAFAVSNRIPVECNSWDTYALSMTVPEREAGPGLAVLNAAAAKSLFSLGLQCAHVSLEIDRRQLEELCAAAETPLSLNVYGRPPLFISRVPIPACAEGSLLEDSRHMRLRGRREGSLSVYRSAEPYSWVNLHNDKVRAAFLTVDLCGSPDSVAEFKNLRERKNALLFNYDRTLR